MLVHTVFFWLKPELGDADRQAFRKGLESLAAIRSGEKLYVGEPAATGKRPIIDSSYDFALTVILKDIAAHDAYQVDPIHKDFIKRCGSMWAKLLVYDAQ